LKSFYNAPKWTTGELKIFKECFENVGLFIDKLPKKKDLFKNNDSKYYKQLFAL
jgi:hypothetical protein